MKRLLFILTLIIPYKYAPASEMTDPIIPPTEISTWEGLKLPDNHLAFKNDITAIIGQTIEKTDITQTIDGNGHNLIGFSDDDNYVFKVGNDNDDNTKTNLTFQNLTITDFKIEKPFLSVSDYEDNNNNILNLDKVTFSNNSSADDSGGAINVYNSTLNIKNSFFKENETQEDGGALQISDGSVVSIDNTQFTDNSSIVGGAINLNTRTKLTVSDSLFKGNYSKEGGAINTSSLYYLYNTEFSDNHATSLDGGAIWSGQMYGDDITNTVLSSSFKDNTADSGGALYVEAVKTDFVDTSFIGNKAEIVGGAIFAGGYGEDELSSFNFIANNPNVIFKANEASYGGALYLQDANVDLVDISFTENIAQEGGAIYIARVNLNIFADNQDVSFSKNTASNDEGRTYNGGGAIYVETSKLNLNASQGKKIVFDDTVAAWGSSVININESGLKYTGVTLNTETRSNDLQYSEVDMGNTGEIQFNNYVGDESGNIFEINLYDGKLSIGQNPQNNAKIADWDSWLDGNNLTIHKGELNTVNNYIGNMTFNELNIKGPTELSVDVDLANNAMDQLTPDTVTISDDGRIDIVSVNLLSDGKTPTTSIVYANPTLQDSITTSLSKVMSEIYKYDVSYDPNSGTFTFKLQETDENGDVTPASFNPYVYEQTITMLFTSHLQKTINAFIFNDEKGKPQNHIWMKMLAFDDDYHYRNLGNVDSETSLIMAGVNSDDKEIGKTTMRTNIYGGAVKGTNRYDSIKSTENGGFIGAETRFFYKNWNYGTNITGGYLRTRADNMYGKDKYNTYWGGLAAHLGYNIALNDKTKIEPGIHVSYTAVKTKDFVSANGLKSSADILEVWDIVPNLKLSRMFTPNWLGYIQTRYILSGGNRIMPEFNNVILPDITTKDYTEYGIGTMYEKGKYSVEAALYRRDGQREGWNGWLGLRIALP